MSTVAICPYTLCSDASFRAALRGRDVRWNESGRRLDGEALIEFIDGAERVVVGLERIDASVIARAPSLKVIAKLGVGLDNLDLDALEAAGVRVGWTPGVNRRAVAELVLAGVLALLRDLPIGDRAIRSGLLSKGGWRPPIGRQIAGLHVGIVGCGHIGLEVARLMRAVGASVSAHDVRDRREHLDPLGASQVSLDEILESADIVTLHLPLDGSTRGILDRARIQTLRGAIVVNTARGELIDEAALAYGLDHGHVGAAFLDVFANEPAAPGPLVDHPRVLVSAHIGGRTEASLRAMADAALRNLDEAMTVPALRARLAEGRIEPP